MTPCVRLIRAVFSRSAAVAAAALLASATPAMAQPEDPPPDEDLAGEPAEPAYGADVEPAADSAGAEPIGTETAGELQAGVAVQSGYKKGFYIKSDDDKFALTTQARVQGRYTFESNDAGDVRDEESNFAVQRARLTLGGHAFTEDVKFKFQSDFGKGEVTLKDFYVDWKVGGSAYVRVGQYKRPFSRQQINSSGNLELVDRSITDKAFNAGRDIGLMIHNDYEKSPEIEWAIGVFNATGDGAVPEINDDGATEGFSNVPALFGPAIVLRGGYNANGVKGYSEADLEGGPLRFGVAASVLAELDADADDQSAVRAEADFVIKLEGLSTTGGVYVATAQDDTGFFDQAYDLFGFHLQGGYMLTDKHQITARYALLSPAGDGVEMANEITAGFSLYQFSHGLKWQSDFGVLIEGDANDLLGRTQLQLSF